MLNLAECVQAGRFKLFYQPVIDVSDETVVYLEALLRLQVDGNPLLNPADFLPELEASMLIEELWPQLLEQAWQAHLLTGDRIALNVSPVQFNPVLLGQLAEFGCKDRSYDWLLLEVTENVTLYPSATEVIQALREMGIRMAVDDFGTGYANLASVLEHQFDVLKLDRRLSHSDDCDLVAAFALALAERRGAKVVAEGIESRALALQMADRGVLYQQGFHHGKPAPISNYCATERFDTGSESVGIGALKLGFA